MTTQKRVFIQFKDLREKSKNKDKKKMLLVNAHLKQKQKTHIFKQLREII